ncbi:unknown [Eubacterium sp. CAG:581]|nr:unknown [Eubacterium sp. CAG:581]
MANKTKVNRTLHTLQLKIRNSSDKKVTLTNLPKIKFIKEDSLGNQSFVKEKVYKDKNGKVQKETTPIYVYPSANQSSGNYNEYCSIKFKPRETKNVTLRYILDNDLYNSAYFCIENEDKTLYKKLSYDYD